MNRAQLEAAGALGCRIQIWHLRPGATSSAHGQWDDADPTVAPTFECPEHLYRVHPDDLHLLRGSAAEIDAAIAYSRNFATAKPDIGASEREHILGLCSLLERCARPAPAVVDEAMVLRACAAHKGEGGKFSLWSKDETEPMRAALTAALAQPQGREAQAVDLEQFRPAVMAYIRELKRNFKHSYSQGHDDAIHGECLLAIIDAQSAKGGGDA